MNNYVFTKVWIVAAAGVSGSGTVPYRSAPICR